MCLERGYEHHFVALIQYIVFLIGSAYAAMFTMFQGPTHCGIMMDNMVSSIIKINKLTLILIFQGLIRWGIVIHGFIDGYSRLITGLRASDNNFASTVLQLFLNASEVYGVPSHLHGDHGLENLLVAAWMKEFRGT